LVQLGSVCSARAASDSLGEGETALLWLGEKERGGGIENIEREFGTGVWDKENKSD
jgi:hypothetical protein